MNIECMMIGYRYAQRQCFTVKNTIYLVSNKPYVDTVTCHTSYCMKCMQIDNVKIGNYWKTKKTVNTLVKQ